jgi:hypothetical protein
MARKKQNKEQEKEILSPRQHQPRKRGSDAEYKTRDAVGGERPVTFVQQQLDVLERECRECREPAAESGRQKYSPVVMEPYISLGESDSGTHDETAEDVHDKSSERKCVGKNADDKRNQKKSPDTAEHSTEGDKQNIPAHSSPINRRHQLI